ncbi:NUDIX domain-containing protein [Candidatus Azambacteria bacterium]|nr:NUDIX domain-containing protein [Candidatus Azambacteria bacterium]
MAVERSAGAVVFRRTKEGPEFLLLQYESGYWGLPKGLMEKREDSMGTARREIAEEAGLGTIEFLPGFKKTIRYVYTFEGKRIFKWVVYFLAETKEKNVKLSFEHKAFLWLPYPEAKQKMTHNKEVIEAAYEFLTKR